ncbi:MAG: glycoside hydrolase family 5 protein [Anaerolineales bacterium]
MLQVRNSEIVNSAGQPVRLRGVCVGGWMNMENFINGYPGDESGVRRASAHLLGAGRAEFLFDRWLDYFFNKDDVAFLKECGANVVRLPLNYRHFEDDSAPYAYREKGFQRLARIVEECARAGLYVILDLHSAQGWQNTDWHCDNSSRHTLIWRHPHFQERFVALWREIAHRFREVETVAGYNLMNEPVTNAPAGRFTAKYETDWAVINGLYRRAVEAIREVDSEHIIFLEGDYFSTKFVRFDPPFAPNLVYSSHNYSPASTHAGKYPGKIGKTTWNKRRQAAAFADHEGTHYTEENKVPLWVGEFGAAFDGPKSNAAYRLQALDDQIAVFEQHRAHWTIWTYKDIGVMGLVTVSSESEYIRRVMPALRAKCLLGVDGWLNTGAAKTETQKLVNRLAVIAERAIGDKNIDHLSNRMFLAQAVQAGYFANLMQPAYASCFRGLSETQIDKVMQSFALRNCRVREGLVEVLKKYWKGK